MSGKNFLLQQVLYQSLELVFNSDLTVHPTATRSAQISSMGGTSLNRVRYRKFLRGDLHTNLIKIILIKILILIFLL